MSNIATIHTLPVLRLTKAREHPSANASPVEHQTSTHRVRYWRELELDKAARWKTFAKFPLVLNADGSLWEPACLWLLDKAQARPSTLTSLTSVAQGLRDYKVFLDDLGLEWDDFSSVDKYARPTYLYRIHLQGLVNSDSLARSTASRRMSTVIGFYRFLMGHPRMQFEPLNEPWVDRQYAFAYRNEMGFKQVRTVVATDVSIQASKSEDAWDATIKDGGKLRPLSVEEQLALVATLKRLGNTEYELMHYVALLTGARVQTVLTMRWGYFQNSPSEVNQWPYKLRCGPGTGIDTKRDVTNVYLSIPRALYEMLHVYVHSERAQRRRAKTRLAEDPTNHLFLTSQGSPYYESKDDRNDAWAFEAIMRRSSPIGQNLREFMAEKVIPDVRKTIPQFKYKFHDLRATFGMNWVDHVIAKDDTKQKYMWARDQLRKLLWHKDAITTDRYLEYRQHMHQLQQSQDDWNEALVRLIRGL